MFSHAPSVLLLRQCFFLVSLAAIIGLAAPIAVAAAGEPQKDLEYRIGPGDLLSIRVSGITEFERSVRVSNSGRLRVPYVGVMMAAGKTALELEREIAGTLQQQDLMKQPAVRVLVEQFQARPAYVIGEVNSPGQFAITRETYLLDLVTKAGGVRTSAADTAFLYRRDSASVNVPPQLVVGDLQPVVTNGASAPAPAAGEPGDPEGAMRIDLKALQDGTKPELNLLVEGGDILYIPRARAENIYIIGDVKVPGAYTLPRRGEITAAQAVVYAGGPLATANMKRGFLMRHNAAGEREAIPVNFRKIIDGEQADIPVLPNDIIFIPNSSVRTIGVGLVNLVPRLLQQFLIF